MRRVQLLLGIVLAVMGFVGVLFVGRLTQPPTFDVAVILQEIPAFTPLDQESVAIDTQSLSPAVAEKYVLAHEWEALLAEGVVTVETLHPGQPLLREQVASGADIEGLSRLAVALDNSNQVILSVPVEQDDLPFVVPGDVVALFFAAGQVQAETLITYTVEFEGPTPTPDPVYEMEEMGLTAVTEPVTITTELEMPLAKWIANGVVYRLNREKRENPNYGAPGMENEPRYIEGQINSLDVVVHRDVAEWVAFALAHGDVQVGVLPALTRLQVESGTFPPGPGVTWTDFEEQFFEEREEVR